MVQALDPGARVGAQPKGGRICWPDASRLDGPAALFPALELQPGPLYSDEAKLAQLQRAEQAARANKAERDALIARKGGPVPRGTQARALGGAPGSGGGGGSRVAAGRVALPPPPPQQQAGSTGRSATRHPGAHPAVRGISDHAIVR